MKKQILSTIVIMIALFTACNQGTKTAPTENVMENTKEFKYLLEQFADLKIMRYQVPGFDELSLAAEKAGLLLERSRSLRKRYPVRSKL